MSPLKNREEAEGKHYFNLLSFIRLLHVALLFITIKTKAGAPVAFFKKIMKDAVSV